MDLPRERETERERNYRLSDKNLITISNKGDCSIALQLPIRNADAIAELDKRKGYFSSQNSQYGDIAESSANYHITIQLFFCKKEQLKLVSQIFSTVLSDYPCLLNIKVTDNAIFGFNQTKYPVALIESPQLQQFQSIFLNRLQQHGINCMTYKDGFKPHVSLFVTGAPLSENSLQDCPKNTVTCTETPNLSHKNNVNQFIVLTRENLAELEARTKKPTKNGLMQNFEQLVAMDKDFDQRWFEVIEKRFSITHIGLFCLQHNISADDMVTALKQMPFDKFFIKIQGKEQSWYNFNTDMENKILDIFQSHLPEIKMRKPHHEPALKMSEIEIYKGFLNNLELDLQLTPFTIKEFNFKEVPGNTRTVAQLQGLMSGWGQHKARGDLDICKKFFLRASELLQDTKGAAFGAIMMRTGVTTQFYERQLEEISLTQKLLNHLHLNQDWTSVNIHSPR